MVSAHEFSNKADDAPWEWDENINKMYFPVSEVSFHYARAPVHLPQGADITAVYCYYGDTNTGAGQDWDDGSLELLATDVGTGLITFVASTTFTAPNTTTPYHLFWQDSTVSGIGDPVDNTQYNYMLRVGMDREDSANSCTSSCAFYGCRINYTMTEVSH
jgi:hypothetical protein